MNFVKMSQNEDCVNVKFCFKLKTIAAETFEWSSIVYGSKALEETAVYKIDLNVSKMVKTKNGPSTRKKKDEINKLKTWYDKIADYIINIQQIYK